MECDGVINSSRIFQHGSESGSKDACFAFLPLEDTGYVLRLGAWSLCSLFEPHCNRSLPAWSRSHLSREGDGVSSAPPEAFAARPLITP